jgi:nitronate monooxygenase
MVIVETGEWVPPAAEIVDRIVSEADQILSGRRNPSAASQA